MVRVVSVTVSSMSVASAVAGIAPGGRVAAPSLMPLERTVPVMVRFMPLVMAVWVTRRASVLLVMLMVMLVPVVLRVLALLVTPMVRVLLVMHWWMVPLVMV